MTPAYGGNVYPSSHPKDMCLAVRQVMMAGPTLSIMLLNITNALLKVFRWAEMLEVPLLVDRQDPSAGAGNESHNNEERAASILRFSIALSHFPDFNTSHPNSQFLDNDVVTTSGGATEVMEVYGQTPEIFSLLEAVKAKTKRRALTEAQLKDDCSVKRTRYMETCRTSRMRSRELEWAARATAGGFWVVAQAAAATITPSQTQSPTPHHHAYIPVHNHLRSTGAHCHPARVFVITYMLRVINADSKKKK
ncbi:hypothetical protein BJV78DRAFT_1352828, partial [Lactifluus subvellereus]